MTDQIIPPHLAEIDRHMADAHDLFLTAQELAAIVEVCQRVKLPVKIEGGAMTDAENKCEWKEDFEGDFETSCGQCFTFFDGGPSENKMRFCCYCGKHLAEVPHVEDLADYTGDESDTAKAQVTP